MNEETIGLWLREMEHLHAHFLHKYYVTVNHVMVEISNWWLQLNHHAPVCILLCRINYFIIKKHNVVIHV